MYLQTWRVRAQSERARSKTAHDRAHAHRFRTSQRTLRSRSKRTRRAKQRKTSQHHAGNSATSEQSRFAHDLQVSRSVSSAEHGSRQLSWRTCGLTRRTKNHGTSLGGAFRRNTVYHVTSSTKSDGVSDPVCCVQVHRLGKNK